MTTGKIKLKDAPDIEVPTGLYIGGKFRDATGGGTFPVLNPATEQPLCSVADGTVDDAKAAIEAAAKAFPAWGAKSPRERGEVLRKCFELFTAKKEFFARLMTLENGKALVDSARRGHLRRRVLPLVRRGGAAQHRRGLARAFDRRPDPGPAQARRHRRAGDAVEFPRRDGHAQDRARARRRLHRGA